MEKAHIKKTKRNKPLVSIILSTYNGQKYISESIDSVLNQSFRDYEFIIINDSSRDNVEEIILTYKENDSRIIYIKNQENLWLTKSLNLWINKSNWIYVARIDDDDIWNSEKLQKQIDFMEWQKEYGLVWTSIINIDKNWEEQTKTIMRVDDEEIRKNILKSNQFVHSSVLIQKKALKLAWWFYDSSYNWAEDYELWLRIWKYAKFHNLPEYLVKYRWLPNSISRKKWVRQEFLTLKVILKNKRCYPSFYKSFLLRVCYFIVLFLKNR